MKWQPSVRAFFGDAGVFGCIGALLAGCSVGPAYKRPDIPPPTQWHETAGDANRAKSSVWPDAEWWHGFGSTRLDELIADAMRNNDDLAGAIARVQEADQQARIAGAALLPSIDAGFNALREREFVTGAANSSGSGNRLFNAFNPELTASYELDFWGKNRATRDAARAAAAASRYDRQTVALTVIGGVATTYFQALELRDRLEVAQQNLDNGEAILRGFRLEQTAGTATGLDVAQQETAVALLNAAVPPLRQQFRQTVHALAVLIGKTPESVDVETGTLTQLSSPAVVEGLPSQLLSRRPDVAEAEQNLIAANADITVARAALFPDIQLTAVGGYESEALAGLVSPANRIYSIAAGLTQPIFRGGALHAQVAFSKARYTELLTTYHKTVLTAFSNVEDALVATRQTAELQKRQQEAVMTAKRAFEFAERQMSAGTVNILTVLNTENALFGAQDQLVQDNFLRLQAMVNLFAALGGGWHQG